ncbi:OmpA family protein [Mucilaginibacter sp. SP1R1]|uniref:OmpA family protein n=1 Tax=Mucilaginibacter sp. SP1R1 TaxID=2723091 RepID=UPI00161C6B59|nr:OmpA family protein [Mucilaginibacter sp. SP1R1]MBB6150672.1 OOP family OmpA-OmpF porin [Mucilaginibacter sp. SP1R1]
MKTTFFTLASIALMLLTINAGAFTKPHKVSHKNSSRSSVRMSVEEMTKNVEFAFAKIDIHAGYNDQLDQLAKLLVDKNYALVLRGHADSIGNYIANWKLSGKRADAIKDYLVKKGVSPIKIVTSPFGSTQPIATNKTKQGRQKNRRVEIRIS